MSDRWAIPDDWSWSRLGDIAEVIGGGTPSTSDSENFADNEVPWITPADLSGYDGTYISRGRRAISRKGLADSGAKLMPKGSVLFSSRAPIGYCVIAENELSTNQGFKSLVLRDGMSSEYTRYYLLASKDYAESLASGTTFKELSGKKMADMVIPVPPMDVQRRIVAKLDALLAQSRAAREQLEAVPALVEQYRQSVLAAAFRGDLTADWRKKNPNVEPASKLLERIRIERRQKWEAAELAKFKAKGKAPKDDKWKSKYVEPEPVDTSDLPELPPTWCWARWSQIASSQNGRPFPSSDYSDRGIRLLRPGNLHVSGEVRWTTDNTKCMPERYADDNDGWVVGPNQLVMNLTAQSLKDEFLGRVCMTGSNERCLLNQRIAWLKPSGVSPRFAFWLLKSPAFRRFVDGLNSGTLIQHMFTSQLDDWAFALPSLSEQEAITRSVEEAFVGWNSTSTTTRQAADELPKLERSLLAKAFRGELVS